MRASGWLRDKMLAMASKRNVRRKACKGKMKHQSKQAASAHAYGLMKRGKTRGGSLHPYPCSFCGGWHVGHMSKRALQAMTAKRSRHK